MTFTLDPELPRTRTPCDYTRIHFDPSQVPDRRIVGLLACQRDPLLRKLRTKVHAAAHFKEAVIPKRSKAEKGGAKAVDVTSGKLWEVELLDTVIFPEGGGQPADNGVLTFVQASSPALEGRSLRVEAAYRRSLHALHLVRVPEELEDAFASVEGLEVEVEVDWERRMDHMSIHTAQHLLSSVFEQKPFNLPTLSWGMPAFPSLDPPYIELERGMTWQEAADAEKRCNELIEDNRRVWIDVTMQGQVPAEGLDERFERESRGIPKDYDGGVVRAVNIEDQDRNLCCGTQVPQLSMCRMVHVIPPSCSPTATKSSAVPTRLYFYGGPRAQRALIDASIMLSTAAHGLAVSRPLVVEKVIKLDEIKRNLTRKEKGLKTEVIRLLAEDFARHAKSSPSSIFWRHRIEEATNDFDFLNSVAFTIRSILTEEGVEEASLPTIVFTSAVAGSPGLITITATPATAAICKTLGDEIKSSLEALAPELGGKRVKGGGAKGKWMAKADGKWGKSETAAIEAVIAMHSTA